MGDLESMGYMALKRHCKSLGATDAQLGALADKPSALLLAQSLAGSCAAPVEDRVPPPPLGLKIGGGGRGGGGVGGGGGFSLKITPPEAKQMTFALATKNFNHDRLVGGSLHLENLADFDIWEDIGQGACSVVKRAVHRDSGMPVALKQVDVYDTGKRHQLVNELNALRDAQHPNLVRLVGAIAEEGSILIALEFMDGGALDDLLLKVGRVPQLVLQTLAAQLMSGLMFLHSRHLIHRDIKPGNLLVNTAGVAKISDYGISKSLTTTGALSETFVGTANYMAPERIVGQAYSYNSDVWSMGLSFFELAIGAFPFPGTDNYFALVSFITQPGPPPLLPAGEEFSEEFRHFLYECMVKDPLDRKDCSTMMSHSFISSAGQQVPFDFAGWITAVKAC